MEAVRETLLMVNKVNKDCGVPPAAKKQEKDDYKPIESIIFPLLGTGAGGLSIDKVATLMARAIKEFVLDHPETSLKDIYISAYTMEDVAVVEEALKGEFESQDSDGEADGES